MVTVDHDQITSDLEHMLGKVTDLVNGSAIMRDHCAHLIKELQKLATEDAAAVAHTITLIEKVHAEYDNLFNLATSLSLSWNHNATLLIRDVHNAKLQASEGSSKG
jgi:hypothetical protein